MFKGGQVSTSTAEVTSQVSNDGLVRYPHMLNFYDNPPLFDVTVEDFETCALDRLRILAEIESSAARNRSWDELKNLTKEKCAKFIPLNYNKERTLYDLQAERKKDHLSHFVLRLAFCRSEELRRRFIKAESTLFKIRYDLCLGAEREQFLNSRDFNCIPVSQEEQTKYATELAAAQNLKVETEALAEKYYKVKWSRVPDLVEKRKVFLKAGWAYVPSRQQSSIVFQEFEVHLEKALEITARLLPRLDEDTRLLPILDNLSQGFLAGIPSEWAGASTSGAGDDIKAEMVDSLAKKHFPACMRTMHESLQRDNHLKHNGRLNYGLFLKVLGLSIEEAVVFWRKSFSRMTDDKFNKEYKYNIRHSYGLEGKRANYPAKSCIQLLAPGSSSSDYGCPYRSYSPENLQSALLSMYSSQGLRSSDLTEVMANVNSKHYHVACTRVFELTHASYGVKKGDGVGAGEHITHPNQYAARSMELEKAKDKDGIVVE